METRITFDTQVKTALTFNYNTYSCICQSLQASSWGKTEDSNRPASNILLNHVPTNLFILGKHNDHLCKQQSSNVL